MSTDRIAMSALLFGIALIPLQIVPAMPVAGMAAADLFFLLAAVSAVATRPELGRLSRVGLVGVALVVVAALVSAAANGGNYLKLLGHVELGVIAMLVGLAAAVGPKERESIERALLVGALIAAAAAALGIVLYYAGHETLLLNHSGDLVPGNYPRVRGTAVRANQLASVVATGWLLLVARPRLLASDRLRWGAHLILLLALLFTFSRTMPFALLLATGVWLGREKRSRLLWAAWGLVFVIGLGGVFLLSRYHVVLDPLNPLMVELTDEPGGRWVVATTALDTARDHPLLGIGPGGLPAIGKTGYARTAHMTWLNTWAILGIGAVIGLALLFGHGLINRERVFKGAWLALLLILIDTLHRDVEDMRHLWVLFGLLALPARFDRALQGREVC